MPALTLIAIQSRDFLSSVKSWSLDNPKCHDLFDCRSFWNIVYSALLTIVACVWVSIHPNAPGYDDGFFTIFSRRLRLTLIALIAPEIIVLWSLRQWIVARKVSIEHDLSMTHGFFVSMGGFVISSGDGYRPITPSMIGQVIKAGDIARVHVKDIEDKSKGDALSKTVVLFQIVWFITQCIARYVSKLHVTELEIATLGYALLNIATYIVWWNKPLRVDRPIVLHGYTHPAPFEKVKKSRNPIHRISDSIGHSVKLILGTTRFDDSSPRVPILWAGAVKRRHVGVASATSAVLAILFGLIHCLAWWFEFPTWQEQWAWKISSAVIALVPVFFILLYGLLLLGLLPSWGPFGVINRMSQAIAAIGYLSARIVLLTLMIMTLRSLPDDAYRTIPWTKYIPHI